VEAGISAKRQQTMVGAIKTALFNKPEHQASVAQRIKELAPRSILVLGTSDKMADKIVSRLELPPVEKHIHIEDITTEEEREVADRQRHLQGKHVIPAPTLQLKRDFAGYFMDPLRILKGTNLFGGAQYSERTVVRPTFSYMGEFFISDSVITDIANCVAQETDGISRVIKVYENTAPDALCLTISVAAKLGNMIWESAMEFQKAVAEQVENMTAFNVIKVDVEVKQVDDTEIQD
jgi:uncharacterized alkaline shock family protein YloU